MKMIYLFDGMDKKVYLCIGKTLVVYKQSFTRLIKEHRAWQQ